MANFSTKKTLEKGNYSDCFCQEISNTETVKQHLIFLAVSKIEQSKCHYRPKLLQDLRDAEVKVEIKSDDTNIVMDITEPRSSAISFTKMCNRRCSCKSNRKTTIRQKPEEENQETPQENLQENVHERPIGDVHKTCHEKVQEKPHEKPRKLMKQFKPTKEIIPEEIALTNTKKEKESVKQSGTVETKNTKQRISKGKVYSKSVEDKELEIAENNRNLEKDTKASRNSFSLSEHGNSTQTIAFPLTKRSWENLALKINSKDHKELRRQGGTDESEEEHNVNTLSENMSCPVRYATNRTRNEKQHEKCQSLVEPKEIQRRKSQHQIKKRRAKEMEMHKLMLNYDSLKCNT